jgi:predicted GIY-YIG superfamily endonuclease
MTSFQLNYPPACAGLYFLKHVPSQRVYVGGTKNLKRRLRQWRDSSYRAGLQSKLYEAFGETELEDWEFVVAKEMPGADLETLKQVEEAAIKKILDQRPESCLNTDTAVPPQRGDGGAKTTLTYRGKPISQTQAAVVLGCQPNTVSKRLAQKRKRGVFSVTVEELLELTKKWRVETPVTKK